MCGLTLSIRLLPTDDPSPDEVFTSLVSANSSRGPDSSSTYTHSVHLASGHIFEVSLAASVLGLRGREVVTQPMIGKRGVLGWNGQVFDGMDLGVEDNDTRKIFERLESGEAVEEILRGIEGPYSFIYLDLTTDTIHLRLDPLSRRSLLLYPPEQTTTTTDHQFILSSTRSTEAREQGMEMRALRGGEGGIFRLRDLLIVEGRLDGSRALHFTPCLPGSDVWVQVAPLNSDIPSSAQLTDPEPECHVARLTSELLASVRRRIINIPPPKPREARLAILFSGGVDCTFLAYLAHLCLPPDEPIELVNVAFEQSPIPQERRPPDSSAVSYDVPDRITGRQAVAELEAICGGRQWRFVEVDIPYLECQAHRQRALDLMYPSSTEMDLSLAYPLYFASRGVGTLAGEKYLVKAKVYISGLGADEQLGGYARHRRAYESQGWQGLIAEIGLDISRLPERNLSRDDRVISSHARDARYPYLDLSFIHYLSALPMPAKMDPEMREGVGDKRLLRLAAAAVGLCDTAHRVKRAMQFGTRSSRMGLKRHKGPGAGNLPVE